MVFVFPSRTTNPDAQAPKKQTLKSMLLGCPSLSLPCFTFHFTKRNAKTHCNVSKSQTRKKKKAREVEVKERKGRKRRQAKSV